MALRYLPIYERLRRLLSQTWRPVLVGLHGCFGLSLPHDHILYEYHTDVFYRTIAWKKSGPLLVSALGLSRVLWLSLLDLASSELVSTLRVYRVLLANSLSGSRRGSLWRDSWHVMQLGHTDKILFRLG